MVSFVLRSLLGGNGAWFGLGLFWFRVSFISISFHVLVFREYPSRLLRKP